MELLLGTRPRPHLEPRLLLGVLPQEGFSEVAAFGLEPAGSERWGPPSGWGPPSQQVARGRGSSDSGLQVCPSLGANGRQPGCPCVSLLTVVRSRPWGRQERNPSLNRLVSLDCAPLRVGAPGPGHPKVLPRAARGTVCRRRGQGLCPSVVWGVGGDEHSVGRHSTKTTWARESTQLRPTVRESCGAALRLFRLGCCRHSGYIREQSADLPAQLVQF